MAVLRCGDRRRGRSRRVADRGRGARPPGLLATVSGVLADAGLDIIDAAVATWGDGAALDTFSRAATCSTRRDSSDELQDRRRPIRSRSKRAIVAAFDEPLESLPNPDAELRFDDHASPVVHDLRGAQPRPTRAAPQSHRGDGERRRERALGAARDDRGHRGRPFRADRPQRRKLDDAAKEAVLAAVRNGVTHEARGLLSRALAWTLGGMRAGRRHRWDVHRPRRRRRAASPRCRRRRRDPAACASLRRVSTGSTPDVLAHGTTVATNALLERRLGRVALVTTRGFADVHRDRAPGAPVAVRRARRPAGAARAARAALRGRRPPRRATAASSKRSTASCPDVGPGAVDAVAVCLLHADLDPVARTRASPRCSRARGFDVVCSHEVSPEFREYERTVTTVADAALRAGVPRRTSGASPALARRRAR